MSITWQTLIPNEVWWCQPFLEVDTLDRVLAGMSASEISVLDGSKRKHAVGDTYYNYNVVKLDVRQDRNLIDEVFGKLNQLLIDLGETPVDTSQELGYLQFFAKSFNAESRYDLHAETRAMFGKYVFVAYLSDENTGELVLPTEQEADAYLDAHPANRQGWQQTRDTCAAEGHPVRHVGPLTIRPRLNGCVVMKTGAAHYVNPVTDGGWRPTLSGWVYATDAYVNWYKSNNTSQ